MKEFYTVAVIGFDQTEKIVLGSIFGLAARRNPRFVQAQGESSPADLYLVDAADAAAIDRFKALNPERRVPSILIGDSDHGTGWPVLKRPLQWTRLFKAFDLAIAKPLTQRMGSTTGAQPARPGTTAAPFAATMRIQRPPTNPPAAPATPAPTRPLAASRPPTGATPAPAARTLSTKTIVHAAPATQDLVMVVDDSPTVREFMRTKLEPFAFQVDYAASGEEAIGNTATKHYACIFLDVVMPGMDGYQVCKLIKARQSIRRTAVVMLTSRGSPFDKIRGTMAGCDAYLTKPVDEERLLEVISKFIPQSG